MDAADFLKLLVDPDRLAVAGLVAAGPRSAAELAAMTRRRERDVLAALAPLIAAGMVVRKGSCYALVRESLRAVARTCPSAPRPIGGSWPA